MRRENRDGRDPADRGRLTGVGMALMAALLLLVMLVENGFDVSAVMARLGGGGDGAAEEAATPRAPAATPQATPVKNGGDGRFDYYVLSLSWSPSYCAAEPEARQCGKGLGFVVHGLWPQFERGYPSNCSAERLPDALLAKFDGLTVSRGLLAHQWRKHGSCSGLSAEAYFETMARAAKRIQTPPFERLDKSARVDPRAVESAFLAANPGLERAEITITCKSGDFAEARICLDKNLEPRRCGADVIKDCSDRMIDLPLPR